MVLPTQIVDDASSLHKCTDEEGAEHASFQQPACSAPSFFSTKKAFQLLSRRSSNEPSPENFMTIGGCFECYRHILCYGTKLAEERGKKEEERKKERKKEDKNF